MRPVNHGNSSATAASASTRDCVVMATTTVRTPLTNLTAVSTVQGRKVLRWELGFVEKVGFEPGV